MKIGETVDEFRARAIQRHLFAEMFMNNLITTFISGNKYNSNISGALILDNLIMDAISFRRKIEIISAIFKDNAYHELLLKTYENKIDVNEKGEVIGIQSEEGTSLSVREFIKSLETINSIRNHLAHTLVIDVTEVISQRPYENSPLDMNKKGDMDSLDRSYIFVSAFFNSWKIKKQK
jgi:hypothetical protein